VLAWIFGDTAFESFLKLDSYYTLKLVTYEMQVKTPTPFTLACFFLIGVSTLCLSAAPTKKWNQGDPSDEEQYALERLNLARKDPIAYDKAFYDAYNADPIATGIINDEIGGAYAIAQRFADTQVAYANKQADFAKYGAISRISNAPFVLYPALTEQASRWNLACVANYTPNPNKPYPQYVSVPWGIPELNGTVAYVKDFKYSVPFTGSNATGGIANYGPYGNTYYDLYCLNFYAPYIGAREAFFGSARDNRNLFKDSAGLPTNNDYSHMRMVGLSVRNGDANNRIFSLFRGGDGFFTQHDLPYGTENTVFITGVLYQDRNKNRQYDIGEGLGGASILADKGDWYAVASASGGFAFPVPANSGAYILTVSSGPLQGQTITVNVAGESVKADWVLPADPLVLPTQVPVADSSGSTQLTGLSTRGLVEVGANALFGGFVISGNSTAKKRVLIRGVGPTLNFSFKIGEAILGTTLDVYNSSGLKIASNTYWKTNADKGSAVKTAAASAGDFPLVSDYDSALVLDLPPGGYTAVVRPPDDFPVSDQTKQIGLLEVYDLTPTVGGRFVNVATRGRVDVGIRQMIVGCTVSGSGLKRVLIRGVGSELGKFGVAGVLPNPLLTLYNNDGSAMDTNDDWSNSAQTTQIRSLAIGSGAFALTEGSPDSSIIRLLAPGNYTAAVVGQTGSLNNGVAIVELYETP